MEWWEYLTLVCMGMDSNLRGHHDAQVRKRCTSQVVRCPWVVRVDGPWVVRCPWIVRSGRSMGSQASMDSQEWTVHG